jgi:CubicO group peptidase (beta-lactamase class C family)
MKKTVVIVLLVLCCCNILTAKDASRTVDSLKLDTLMTAYAANNNFNGVAFVSYGNRVLLNKGYGFSNFALNAKNNELGVYQMGSNTKQFTAELVLMLAGQQMLNLADPISKYFPGYPEGDNITITNLLGHTSGIHNYTDDSLIQQNPTQTVNEKLMLAQLESAPLEFKPGSKFQYSNSNYLLLGYIIEHVTHEKYEHVMRRMILEPLGMTHSGFDYANLKSDNKTTGYLSISDGKPIPSPITDSTLSFAAGSLYSTAADIYKWHNALSSYKLLPREWQEKAFSPGAYRYGFGWFVDTLYNTKVEGHPGGIHGYYTYFMRSQENDLCIILLQNVFHSDADNNEIAVNIVRALLDPAFVASDAVKKTLTKTSYVTVSADKLKALAGNYSISPKFKLTVSVSGGDISIQASGQPAFKLHPESETLFFLEEANAQVEFVRKNDGSVEKLLLHQGGQTIPAKKENI